MTYKITDSTLKYCMGTRNVPKWKFSLCCLLTLLLPFFGFAQKTDDEPAGDEIIVTLEVKGVGSIDIPAVYKEKDKDVYLSITNVFDLLKIKNTPSP